MENRKPQFWGCDFDPNPDMNGIRKKLTAFLYNQGRSSKQGPYDLVRNNLSASDLGQELLFGGKYDCPSWLTATPDFAQELYPETYRQFINKGGCRDLTFAFGKWVAQRMTPGTIPVILGVDHCLTGGFYQSLKDKLPEPPLLVVLDRHLDAISPYWRNQMVGYSLDTDKKKKRHAASVEYYGPDFRGGYDTGSFLIYLLENKLLRAENLIVLGNQDEPGAKLRTINDPRISGYLAQYDSLEQGGARIIPLRQWLKQSFRSLRGDLAGCLAGRSVYLSVDVDVFSDILGQNARYGANGGIGLAETRSMLEWMGLPDAHIQAMDIMELDVNMLRESGVSPEAAAQAYLEILKLVF